MGLKLQDAISIARGILNDTTPEYRYSDADLIEYGNGALRALPGIKPHLLYTEGEVGCEAGKALQSISFNDAHSLLSVIRVKNGGAVLPCDKAALNAFMPDWMSAPPGAAVNWMPNGDDPVRFFIYPPAPSAQVLEVIYIRIPGPYAAADDTQLPDTIKDAVAAYMVGMAEARDDEHVNSGRAAQFLTKFAIDLGVKINQPQKEQP